MERGRGKPRIAGILRAASEAIRVYHEKNVDGTDVGLALDSVAIVGSLIVRSPEAQQIQESARSAFEAQLSPSTKDLLERAQTFGRQARPYVEGAAVVAQALTTPPAVTVARLALGGVRNVLGGALRRAADYFDSSAPASEKPDDSDS
jgi:hypothetical protein